MLAALLSALAGAGTVTYTYDDLGRLKTVNENGQFIQYELDAAGNRTSVSSADTAAPSVPTGLAANAVAHNQVNLSWNAAVDTGGAGLAGYKLYRNGTYLTSTAALTHSDTTVAASTTYSYQVSAYDAATPTPNESAQSAAVGVTTPPPPSPGSVQLSSSSYSAAESAGSVTMTVTRTGGSAGAASVNYATANGTASAGSDYTATSGTLNWAHGDSANKTFGVPILGDSLYEGNETFTVTLSGAVGATLGSPSSATVTIVDDDPNVPGVPTNLRLSPPVGNGGNYSVLWNAPAGSINHYTLEEVKTFPGSPVTTTYPVTGNSKAFNKGNVYLELTYRVRACATANESQCSAYSSTVFKTVCPSSGCP